MRAILTDIFIWHQNIHSVTFFFQTSYWLVTPQIKVQLDKFLFAFLVSDEQQIFFMLQLHKEHL